MDDSGTLHNDPDSISEVFAQFYEELYNDELDMKCDEYDKEPTSLAVPLTIEEVEIALRALKKGRTGAEDGLVAEMLKTCHRGLVETLTHGLLGRHLTEQAGDARLMEASQNEGDFQKR